MTHAGTAFMTRNCDGEEEVSGRPDSVLTLSGKADTPPHTTLGLKANSCVQALKLVPGVLSISSSV